MTAPARRYGYPWLCSCGNELGTRYREELTINNGNVLMVQTKQGGLIVQCSKCGNLKTWFARPELALLTGLRGIMKYNTDELIEEFRGIIREEIARQEHMPEKNGVGVPDEQTV